MKVIILDDDQTVWERNEEGGVACLSHCADGTQHQIIEMLERALEQAKGELACFDDPHRGVPLLLVRS
jgi:hypothetical protein